MALDGVPRRRGSPKTVEQLFHSDDATGLGRIHDQEEDHLHHGKKLSILAKVKESARKWRQTLVKKRHGHDANHTPSWGVTLEDYVVDQDTESRGNPTHECQHVGKNFRDSERPKPVSDPMFYDKQNTSSFITNIRPGNFDPISPRRRNKIGHALAKSHSHHEGGTSSSIPKVTIHDTLQPRSFRHLDTENHPRPSPIEMKPKITRENDTQKEKVLHSKISVEPDPDETKVVENVEHLSHIEKKEDRLNPRNTCKDRGSPSHSTKKTPETEGSHTHNSITPLEEVEKQSPTKMKGISEAMSEVTSKITSKMQGLSIGSLQGDGETGKWDKGVSVTEYLKCKLEPGEDERALSQVITEVISPRRNPSEKGVVEKMKTAVTLLLQSEEDPNSSSLKTTDASFPVSTNAHEVEEENQGRVLQAN